MARKTRPKLPLVDCDGPDCDSKLRQTKPSRSGLHFCSRKPCQADKQRRYQTARRAEQVADAHGPLIRAATDTVKLLKAVAHGPREQCPKCGLMNAIPGWSHPDQYGGPCRELGGARPSGTPENIQAVWPESTRKYADA